MLQVNSVAEGEISSYGERFKWREWGMGWCTVAGFHPSVAISGEAREFPCTVGVAMCAKKKATVPIVVDIGDEDLIGWNLEED